MFLKKTFTFLVLGIFSFSTIFVDISSALSNPVVSPENYPGKMEVKNVEGLGKNISTDFFAGGMVFQYPMIFPTGSRGMAPSLALTYNSNNTDAFSPYGYGFSLTLPRIQHSLKKGTSELYTNNEFSFAGNDLIAETGSTSRFRSKDASDMNLYLQSGSTWIVSTADGKKMYFGQVPTARIADLENPTKIFAWMLTREEDIFGHGVDYVYFLDGGQPYLQEIRYGYDTVTGTPTYAIQLSYKDKTASLVSYRTQFEVSTKKLLSAVTLVSEGTETRSYELEYDHLDETFSHLTRITETVPGGAQLPATVFGYGSAQYQHMITSIDNNRGGKARFEYTPSTGYRDGSGALINSKLPFIAQTLSRQILEDSITGIKSDETYEYAGGHYYYDMSDLWGREYVGFAQVAIRDEKTKKTLSFHQSQTTEPNPLKYQDHIAKKGRIYKTDIFDTVSKKLLSSEYTRYDMRTLFGERRLVFPVFTVQSLYDENTHRDIATEYQFDDIGNILEEKQLGWVTFDPQTGNYMDIPGDTVIKKREYTSNISKNLFKFLSEEKIFGFDGGLLLSTELLYDSLPKGSIESGLVTTKIQNNVEGGTPQTEMYTYSPTGMTIQRKDAEANITTLQYDSRDIALLGTTNPLGWQTQYGYSYAYGKPVSIIDQNALKTRFTFDSFGRQKEVFKTLQSQEKLLSRTTYDDGTLPNSVRQEIYFDDAATDKKLQKTFSDGWGRTIASLASLESAGKYAMTHIRYDDDGNPIYASYPISTQTEDFDPTTLIPGSTDGEAYRARMAGASYTYDALDRVTEEHTSRGRVKKSYTANTETLTNEKGYSDIATYDAYRNLISFNEQLVGKDIITTYNYDGLGRPITMTDALGNTRSWKYDGFGRLSEATDIHAPSDTTFGKRAYEYNNIDAMTKYTNANGEAIRYEYDSLGRIIKEILPSGKTRDYTYDQGIGLKGALIQVADDATQLVYSYDSWLRRTGESRNIQDKTYTLGYQYDLQNNLTQITYPDGGKTDYTLHQGYTHAVDYTPSSGSTIPVVSGISYAPNGTIASVTYGNIASKNITRDPILNYRLSNSNVSLQDGTKLLDTTYQYDSVGNIDAITEGGVEPLRKSIDYVYDPLDRLTSANYNYTIAGYNRLQTQNIAYAYDDIGNITSASPIGNYQYAQTGYANPHAVTSASGMTYSYDQAGQTVGRNTPGDILAFTYSPYGEMLSSSRNGENTVYAYDHTRRRVLKSTTGLIEHHVIDGYEVEYESGALVPVSSGAILPKDDPIGTGSTASGTTNTGTTNTGSTASGTTLSGSTSTGTTSSGTTSSGVTNTGTTSTGGVVGSGSTSTGETLSGTTSSGTTDTGSTSSGSMSEPPPGSDTGVIIDDPTPPPGDTGDTQYMVIASASYEAFSGATPVTLTTTLTHIYLGDERIATFQSQTDDSPKTPDDDRIIYHFSDHLNSSSVDVSGTGLLLQATDTLPFGQSNTYEVTSKRIKGKKGGYKNKYLFANKQLDDETDLQYFEKRYYDNTIGLFTTEDPVFYEVSLTKRPSQYFTDPQQWNTYSYVRNNPINLVDPTGESSNPGQQFMDTLWQAYNQGYTSIMDDVKSEVKAYQQAAEQLPVTGDASTFYAAVTGKTLFTGEQVSGAGRLISGVSSAFMITPLKGIRSEVKAGADIAQNFLRSSSKPEAIKLVQKSMLESFKNGTLGKLADFSMKYSNGGKESLTTLKITLNDTRYKATDGWVKRAYNQVTQAGVNLELHFFQNTKTGKTSGAKFK